jgi:hypothetical protein
LGKVEIPAIIGAGRNGELLVGGRYSLGSINDRYGGFVLRIAPNGTLLASLMTHVADPGVVAYGPVLPAGDGTLWAAEGRTLPDASRQASVVRLDETTLATLGTVQSPVSNDFTVERAVMLDGATLAMSGVRRGGKPVIAVVRTDQQATLQLPQPGAVLMSETQVAALPGGDLLFGASYRVDGSQQGAGQYFSRLHRNPDGSLALDAGFGDGGILTTAHPPMPDCPALSPPQDFRRFTYWKGRPTAIGYVETSCDPATKNLDYVVLRLDLDAAFGDGFE